jgi:hypothetical protein
MTRKQWMLIAMAIVLGGFSLYLNKDWFAKDSIQIYHRSRPARATLFQGKRAGVLADNPAINPLVFGFDRKVKLTSVQVIPVSDIETNKYPQPIWHLISDSNSVPTKDFSYGLAIKGMRPALKDTTAEPLEPGVKYRLLIEAGEFKAQHDFVPDPRTP